ncbi:response regulator transcription factor [Chitinophaga sancti]|uniref:Response regulator transcription factor n=1 Tax=Chitinophaga sancti TaxID=1004 RepID=A0A1K1M683_9BACT|nr:response regulator transcription factor [Chitinophaga sancti]WQD64604.1 response regulator transcription factor [Chitinophaga sancti]WQG89772.1 response regulator transcription factor [Chitinophaga sancti]SFW18593.1 two component transcriptional regulator, LuxR family [Chitinophaga sancti]
MNSKVKIVLADDHVLLRNGLARVIESFGNYDLLFEANNGKDLIEKLDAHHLPDIVLLDINMPELDGYETCLWLRDQYPVVRVLALSMYDNETAVIRMFKAGARGYILKDCEPAELRSALAAISGKGFYYSEMVTGKLISSISGSDSNPNKMVLELNDRELIFLKMACTEMTYKEIADKMCLSARTIDGYRDSLFEKLNVKTRVGLVTYALKNGIVLLDNLP